MAIFAPLGPRVNHGVLDDPMVRGVIAPAVIEGFARAAGHRWRRSYWSPYVTFLPFLLEVIDGAKTLHSAVALRHIHKLASGGTERSVGPRQREDDRPGIMFFQKARRQQPPRLRPVGEDFHGIPPAFRCRSRGHAAAAGLRLP